MKIKYYSVNAIRHSTKSGFKVVIVMADDILFCTCSYVRISNKSDSIQFQMCTQKGQATDHICKQFVYLDKTSTLAIVVAQ